ncbi:MAG TPA: hypothetical protein VHG51_08475 [Longimicrobiaceae bacterium]|nr:hypothetical protein [Longimicrobiaceae bacterium]
MNSWLRRIGSAAGRGLSWAVTWAPAALLIGLVVDPDNSMDEMWVAIGAYPGFICGVLFSVLLGIAERGRRIDEVSLPRLAALGAAAGLPVGAFPFAVGEPTSEIPLWLLASTVIGCIASLSAGSAVGTALVSRSLRRRRLQSA